MSSPITISQSSSTSTSSTLALSSSMPSSSPRSAANVSDLLSVMSLDDEMDLFFVMLLDSYYHSLAGFIHFVESHRCFSFETTPGRERFLRLIFSLRNAVAQFPTSFEFNLKSIDRMVKLSLYTTTCFPWQSDDLTRPQYMNLSFTAAPYENRPNRVLSLAAISKDNKELEDKHKQLQAVNNDLRLKKNALLQARQNKAALPSLASSDSRVTSKTALAAAGLSPGSGGSSGNSNDRERLFATLDRTPTEISVPTSVLQSRRRSRTLGSIFSAKQRSRSLGRTLTKK